MLFLMAPDHQASTAPASSVFDRRDLNKYNMLKHPFSVLQKGQEV